MPSWLPVISPMRVPEPCSSSGYESKLRLIVQQYSSPPNFSGGMLLALNYRNHSFANHGSSGYGANIGSFGKRWDFLLGFQVH